MDLARYALKVPIAPGDVALTDQSGAPATLGRYQGQVVALYFGYTYCPDLCPATLTQLTQVKKRLGAQGGGLRVVFISVDPHRDNPARLRAYLSNFDPSFVGLTGSPQAIAAIAKHYGVRYEVEGSQQTDTYLIAHTGYVYLLDRQGQGRYLFPLDAPLEVIIRGVQALEHS